MFGLSEISRGKKLPGPLLNISAYGYFTPVILGQKLIKHLGYRTNFGAPGYSFLAPWCAVNCAWCGSWPEEPRTNLWSPSWGSDEMRMHGTWEFIQSIPIYLRWQVESGFTWLGLWSGERGNEDLSSTKNSSMHHLLPGKTITTRQACVWRQMQSLVQKERYIRSDVNRVTLLSAICRAMR